MECLPSVFRRHLQSNGTSLFPYGVLCAVEGRMAHQITLTAPLEFAKLLELLNTAEEQPETIKAHRNGDLASAITDSEPFMLPEDPSDLVENPFAAHVAWGMWKMNGG